MPKLALAVFAAILLVASFALGATTNTQAALTDLGPIVFSVDGTAALTTAADASYSGSKGAHVVYLTAGGHHVNLLVRVQRATNGTFIDVVGAGPALADLATAVGTMNFSARNHPSPTVDAVDTAVLTAAQN